MLKLIWRLHCIGHALGVFVVASEFIHGVSEMIYYQWLLRKETLLNMTFLGVEKGLFGNSFWIFKKRAFPCWCQAYGS